MAKFPVYEQQTAYSSPRADSQAFGADVAQASGQIGEAAFNLGVQMKRREDVIERVQLLNDFDSFAQQAITAIQDTDDIGKKETLDKFSEGLRQKAGEIVKAHRGTGASRAELQAQIDNQVGQYTKSAFSASVKAQQQMIGRKIEQSANELAIKGALAPEAMGALFEQFDQSLSMFGDAMSPEQTAAYREAGRSQIAQGAIQRMLVNGQWQSAKSMLENPEVARYLNPDAARKFSIDVVVDERKAEMETKRQEANVSRIAQIARRNLTPEEVQRARTLPEKKNMTVVDKITEYELVTGKPAPQDVIDEFYDIDRNAGNRSAFGNSLQGRALDFVTQNAVAYANGMLSGDQARMFETMYAEAYKPIERQDPATGAWTKITPTIPGFAQQAMERGRSFYGGVGGGAGLTAPQTQGAAPMPGQRIQYTDPSGRVIGQTTVGPDGTWSMTDQNPPQQPTGGTPTPSTPLSPGQDGRTIWERRSNIVGPISAATSAVNKVPGVGPAVAGAMVGEEQARQVDVDRTFVENASRDLIRVLQNNPRFAEGERQAIEKEISISPEIFRSQESFEAKLIGIAQSLSTRKREAQNALASGAISIEERKRNMDNIQAIDNFMGKLGLPVVVTSEDEVKALPPGTLFMDPKGNEFRKR